VAHKLRLYQVTVYFGGLSSMCDEEEHEISHTPTSQLEVQPRFMGCANFTVKSEGVFCS